VIAVDSGFLYALADVGDAWHLRAMAQRHTVEEGWITTWPVLAEVCHLYLRRLGTEPATVLMADIGAGLVEVWSPPSPLIGEFAPLLCKYAALPMDLADASLVLLAEHLGHGRILTTDERDFGAYRWKSRKPFKNVLAAAA
jgi:uncharacterized protein